MTQKDDPQALLSAASAWWSTDIVRIEPGVIEMRGYRIQELIGKVGFAAMIWLMLRGELPGPAQAALLEAALGRGKGKPIPMNIDGATATIYAELGFAPLLGRGLFILSRSVGILAHAWEQTNQGGRIKGPMHPGIPYRYTGGPRRGLPSDRT